MDIKQLREMGAFVPAPPVPVEVTWSHPDPETGEHMDDTFTIFVKKMSVGWFDRVVGSSRSSESRSRTALLISEGVFFGENGSEKMSYEDACSLDFGFANALIDAFNRVNERNVPRDEEDSDAGPKD